MPVVINEFEVVETAPAATRGPGDEAAASPAAPPLPRPEDLGRLLAELDERALRRYAH
jgi:hypothetical protein